MQFQIEWAGPINYAALSAAVSEAVGDITALACWNGIYLPNPENKGLPGLITAISDKDAISDPTEAIEAVLHKHDPVFITLERDSIRVGELCKVEVYAPLKDGAAVNLKIADSVIGCPLNKGRGVLVLRGDDPCDIEISLKNGANRNITVYQLRIMP